MGMSDFDLGAADRRAWNAGRKVGAKRALKPRQVWAVRFFLDQHRRMRDRALFDLAVDSKLRGCDIVAVKIGDLVIGSQIRHRAIVVQRKTGKPVQFELMGEPREWHYGQRRYGPHQQVGHMAAPTSIATRLFKLANGGPSTHGSLGLETAVPLAAACLSFVSRKTDWELASN